MGIYKRGQRWWIDCDWRGIPRLHLSTWTQDKAQARAMLRTLEALRDAGRMDILGLISEGKLRLSDVHRQWMQDRESLNHAAHQAESPQLGTLVDAWLAWLKSPATISPRTHRQFAPGTIHRYWESWQGVFSVLELGRDARLADLNRSFCSFYRAERLKQERTGATVNRDMVALSSFLRWCEHERGLRVERFSIPRNRETYGRDRWLNGDEIAKLEAVTPPEYWPLFATLIYTGLRVGEALGLRWQDVDFARRVIAVREYPGHRLKSVGSARDVPMPEPLAVVLTAYATGNSQERRHRVFTGLLSSYPRVYKLFNRLVGHAGLCDVRIHDLRHTYGVHSAQAGVPLPRLQRLLGHSTVAMTMRYAIHAPESYFAEDAAKIAANMARRQPDQAAEPVAAPLKLA